MKKILILAILAGVILGLYFFVFSREEWEDNASLSSTDLSDDKKYLMNLTVQDINKTVFDILPREIFQAEFQGKVFCANHLYGFVAEDDQKIVNVYIYALCEEYYLRGEDVVLGKGVSVPLRISLKYKNDNLIFDSMLLPKDGSEYAESIKNIFPEKYIGDVSTPIDTSTLVPSPKTQADNYFKGKLEVYF